MITRSRCPTVCKMIMKLKNQMPGPKGAVEPVKKISLEAFCISLIISKVMAVCYLRWRSVYIFLHPYLLTIHHNFCLCGPDLNHVK
jgi:hypothetical protein